MADEVKKGYGIFIDGTQYATMEGATTETAGLMTAADKQQLNEMVGFSEETNNKVADIEEEISDLQDSVDTLRSHDLFRTGTSLASGQDLNDVTAYGRYNSDSSSISASLINSPVSTSGFALFVFPSGGQRTQFVVVGVQTSTSTMNYLYMRNMNSSETWTDWYAFSATKV